MTWKDGVEAISWMVVYWDFVQWLYVKQRNQLEAKDVRLQRDMERSLERSSFDLAFKRDRKHHRWYTYYSEE